MTEEERAGCCLLARFIPKRSWDFSSLHKKIISAWLWGESNLVEFFHFAITSISYLIKRTESPANSLLVLTKTLQPVVSRCLFGWPVINALLQLIYYYTCIQQSNSYKHLMQNSWYETMYLKENINGINISKLKKNDRERRRARMF